MRCWLIAALRGRESIPSHAPTASRDGVWRRFQGFSKTGPAVVAVAARARAEFSYLLSHTGAPGSSSTRIRNLSAPSPQQTWQGWLFPHLPPPARELGAC